MTKAKDYGNVGMLLDAVSPSSMEMVMDAQQAQLRQRVRDLFRAVSEESKRRLQQNPDAYAIGFSDDVLRDAEEAVVAGEVPFEELDAALHQFLDGIPGIVREHRQAQ